MGSVNSQQKASSAKRSRRSDSYRYQYVVGEDSVTKQLNNGSHEHTYKSVADSDMESLDSADVKGLQCISV